MNIQLKGSRNKCTETTEKEDDKSYEEEIPVESRVNDGPAREADKHTQKEKQEGKR